MSIFVVVPVRGIATGKSRLSGVLDAAARAQFTTWLLERTLTAVGAWCGTLASCIVVSTCARVAEVSRTRGAMVLDEERCIRCALCVKRCPYDAITMERFELQEISSDGRLYKESYRDTQLGLLGIGNRETAGGYVR